ncbi:vanin-like protein 1 [Phymastichus coffea]|uniref:vanin-like protein 1 n=1 Tax=Phymastichus coffea TaxID=108790 RepID=UPI00273CAF28|nr:vanin-like protein 1 [Phymastichus coffea]XP_058803522.1 vanin-like protein 1 [Phymastichus coffea]
MEMMFQRIMFILVLWPSSTLQVSDNSSLTYVAGIVEYSPVVTSPNEENLGELNAKNYLKILATAITYNVDIIVFPESSLSISTAKNETVRRSQGASYIPDPADKISPCDDKSESYEYSLKAISCAAKEYQIYVLINHREKVNCTFGQGCPTDGFLIYNTNVAFDRKGKVIARYRKYNLFGEYEKNISEAIPTTFDTDFGVTFGTFICFDILFQKPTLNLTHDLKVTDILYSTHWFSEMPYLYAIEAQAAWAYANDVNFLASSYNYPKTASGGAGIYIGKQGHVAVISENKRSNILVVAEVPKVINGKRTQNVNRDSVQIYEFSNEEISTSENANDQEWRYITDDLSVYSTELIDIKQRNYNKTICDRGFCCNFKVEIAFDETSTKNNSNYYHYRFAVFNGTRTFNGVATGGIKTCGIIACINDTLNSCGHLFDIKTITPIAFTTLEISSFNKTNENIFFMPITLYMPITSQKLVPLNVTDFTFISTNPGQYSTYHMALTKPVNNLQTFAIYGRDFSKDGTEITPNNSNILTISPVLLLAIIVVNYSFF